MNFLKENEQFNLDLFDSIVQIFYYGKENEKQNAHQMLIDFQQNQLSWKYVDLIIQNSNSQESRFIALNILENAIKFNWESIETSDQENITNFIIELTSQILENAETKESNKLLLNKLNLILIEILKKQQTQDLLLQIISQSSSSPLVYENTIIIIQLLLEDVFEFSQKELTNDSTKILKEQIKTIQFEIFKILTEVLIEFSQINNFEEENHLQIIQVVISLLSILFREVSPENIYQMNIIDQISINYLQEPKTSYISMKFLADISGIKSGFEFKEEYIKLFVDTTSSLMKIFQQNDLNEIFKHGLDEDHFFLKNIAIFLSKTLQAHFNLLFQQDSLFDLLHFAHDLLLNLTIINEEDSEMLTICFEYWNFFMNILSSNNAKFSIEKINSQNHLNLYNEIVEKLRELTINYMQLPSEIHLENPDEEDFTTEIQSNDIYSFMSQTLICIWKIQPQKTLDNLTQKLSNEISNLHQQNYQQITPFNRICRSISSIGKALPSTNQSSVFLTQIFSILMDLFKKCPVKNIRPIIIANILVIAAESTTFLNSSPKFLKIIINKIFQFMGKSHHELSQISCQAFSNISKRCNKQIVKQEFSEKTPFVFSIISQLNQVVSRLNQQQQQICFQSIGKIISVAPNNFKQELISNLFQNINQHFLQLFLPIQNCSKNPNKNDILHLFSGNFTEEILFILKINRSVSKTSHVSFRNQFAQFSENYLLIFQSYSSFFSSIHFDPKMTKLMNNDILTQIRLIKKEILLLFISVITHNLQTDDIDEKFLNTILDILTQDYKYNIENQNRPPEVLNLIISIISKLKSKATNQIPRIFAYVFDSTWLMIGNDHEQFPEHRINLYSLIYKIIKYCYHFFLVLNQDQFAKIIECLIWGMKHIHHLISRLGLKSLHLLFQKISSQSENAGNFYQQFYLVILNELLIIIFDTFHKQTIHNQIQFLQHLIHLVNHNKILVTLFPDFSDSYDQNEHFVKDFIFNFLKSNFPNLKESQSLLFIEQIFIQNRDNLSTPLFENLVIDFLKEIKKFLL
ncbi:exportin-1 [Anaeramoeba ignava]|uniref:Exportin-1 n=1 Tax=Anaeramoeba ignava TaxID=1746090 RepID=A0A9Q0L6S1_ANAIG|nr:exportin-1 [Anaeramoeba ignava]